MHYLFFNRRIIYFCITKTKLRITFYKRKNSLRIRSRIQHFKRCSESLCKCSNDSDYDRKQLIRSYLKMYLLWLSWILYLTDVLVFCIFFCFRSEIANLAGPDCTPFWCIECKNVMNNLKWWGFLNNNVLNNFYKISWGFA